MLGQFTGEEEPDSSLDFPGGDGGPLVVVGKTGGLGGDALEDVIDERVHDGHGLGGDASVRVNLLQHLVDVDGIGFLPSQLLLLLVTLGDGLGGLARLLGSFSRNFWWHVDRELGSVRLMQMRRVTSLLSMTPNNTCIGGGRRIFVFWRESYLEIYSFILQSICVFCAWYTMTYNI